MKKKNIFKEALSVITAVAMAMTMTIGLPALSFDRLALTASAEDTTVAKVGDVEYTDFATALESWTDGTTLTLMADVTYETTIKIIEKTVTLDLNGHTLDMSALSSPIEVGSMDPMLGTSGYLTIIDSGENGALKGKLNSVTIWTGTLNLEGGDLTGRLYISDTVNMIGGSVYLSDNASIQVDSKCIFNISGGTLSGTSGIWNNGTVNISGSPEITGTNYALANVGGTMTISGTPKLTGETGTLLVDDPITLNTQPADETVWKVKIDGGANGVFAIPGDALEGELDPNKFESAVDGQEVKLLADGSLVLCNHTDTGGKYSVNEVGDGITDSCTVCGEPLGTAAISAEEGTYNGSAYTAAEVTGTGTLENQTWTISYDCPDGCINAGDHTASITLGDVTASKEFTIAPKPITVTADNASKTYGGADPAFSYTVSDNGLVNSDAITGTLSRETGENVGDYAITQGTLINENNPNYDITFVDGTFTINALSVPNTATAVQSNTLTYNGEAQTPVFTVSLDNTTLTADDYDVEVAPQTNAGEYTATIKFKGNYTGTIENAAWSIGKAPLTVTANSYTVKIDTPLPAALEYTAAGLKGTDTIAAIGANVTTGYATAAAPSALGEHTIVVSGEAETANYAITYVNGKLTITEKDIQTITADDAILTCGETGKKITATTNGDGALTYTVATGADVISIAADGTITALKAGTATVTITAAETDGYTAATKTVAVTVNKATVTIKANDYTVKKGDALPTFEYTVTGLVNGDTLAATPVITCTAADTNTVGTFDITITIDITEDDCYTYTAQNGTLTVQRKSSGGGGYDGGGGSYYQPTNPELNGKSASWSTIAADIAKLTYGSEITIELNGNYYVPVDVIKAIAEKDAKVTFIVDSTRSWYIDGKEIDTPSAADLSILAIASLNADALRGDVGAKFRIDGTNIPTELVAAFDKKHAGKFANLYMKKENELVFVDNVKVDENGEVMLPVSEKADYIVMLCEYSDRKGDVSNDGVTNALDASAILRDIVELEAAPNPVMRDYNGDGKISALDASAILKDIVNDRI